MNFAPQIHKRRSIRLPGYDYSQPGGYFVTIVTQGRACIFGAVANGEMHRSPSGIIAQECWQNIPAHFPNVELGTFIIMPNHLHGIIILHDRMDASLGRGTIYRAPTTERFQKPVPGSIPTIVRTYKAAVTREIGRRLRGVPRIWQRNYYEHIIRDEAEHSRIHLYIESNVHNWEIDDENPVRPVNN